METEEKLEQRVRRLEKTISNFKALSLFLLLALISAIACSRVRGEGPVRASEFVLTDGQGKVLATLGHMSSQTCLALGAGKPSSAHLCAGDDYGTSLLMSNHGGKDRAFLSPGEQIHEPLGELAPGLVISEGDGEHSVAVSLGEETKLVVGRSDEEKSVVVAITRGTPGIQVTGPSGRKLWHSP